MKIHEIGNNECSSMKKLINIYILGIRLQPLIFFNLIPIKEFQNKGYAITFINITKIFTQIPQDFNLQKINNNFITYEDASDVKDLNKIVKPNSIAIQAGWQLPETTKVIKHLNQKSIFTITLNLLPINKPNYPAIVYNNVKRKILHPQNLSDAIIVDGYYKELLFRSLGYKKNIWPIHSHIYEQYLQNQEKIKKTIKHNYIVYIDQNFIEHPDFNWFNISKKSFIDYYNELHEFLHKISKQMDLPIKIALHPTANEATYKKYFPVFELVKRDTFNLIHNSMLVIGHYSGAIDYAILSKKKILLVKIPVTISEKISTNQKSYSKKTMIKAISLPFKGNVSKLIKNNNWKRNKYIHKFIKSKNSPQKSFSDIFFMHINSIRENKILTKHG
jgi:hypothetical protein